VVRYKSFDATGVAPNGRLFAGDLNAIQDAVAALSDFTQTHDVSTLRIGATDVQLTRFGANEAQFSGHLRALGILRGLSGIIAGAYTTTQRDAIPAGSRPFTMIIFNTTTARLEMNTNTDASPIWTGLAFVGATAPAHAASHLAGGTDAITWGNIIGSGTLAARPVAGASNGGYLYFASDDVGGRWSRSSGASWIPTTVGLSDAALTNARTPTAHAASHKPGGADIVEAYAKVATTVAGLGTGLDGEIGWLRLGTTPYTFVRLRYDATYGKWVTEEEQIWTDAGLLNFTIPTSSYQLLTGSSGNFFLIPNAKLMYDAGLRIQLRLIGSISNGGGAPPGGVFAAIALDQFNSGENGANSSTPALTTLLAAADAISIYGVVQQTWNDTGWIQPAIAITKDHIRAYWMIRAQSGSNIPITMFGFTARRRWVA
jgi:hypothetical protein